MNDPITDRRLELEGMQNIPDMAAYALEWEKLTADCQAAQRFSLAALCGSKAEHYRNLAGGEYVRLIQDTFVELVEVPFCEETIPREMTADEVVFCIG